MVTFQKNKKTYKVNPRLDLPNKMACLDAMLESDSYFGAIATLDLYLIKNNIEGFENINTVGEINQFIEDGFLDKMLEVNGGSLKRDYDEMIHAYEYEKTATPLVNLNTAFMSLITEATDSLKNVNLKQLVDSLKKSIEKAQK